MENDRSHKDKDELPEGMGENKREVIYDASGCSQDIAYPADLGLLNISREITEEIIDEPHAAIQSGKMPKDIPENSPKSLSEGCTEQKFLKNS